MWGRHLRLADGLACVAFLPFMPAISVFIHFSGSSLGWVGGGVGKFAASIIIYYTIFIIMINQYHLPIAGGNLEEGSHKQTVSRLFFIFSLQNSNFGSFYELTDFLYSSSLWEDILKLIWFCPSDSISLHLREMTLQIKRKSTFHRKSSNILIYNLYYNEDNNHNQIIKKHQSTYKWVWWIKVGK